MPVDSPVKYPPLPQDGSRGYYRPDLVPGASKKFDDAKRTKSLMSSYPKGGTPVGKDDILTRLPGEMVNVTGQLLYDTVKGAMFPWRKAYDEFDRFSKNRPSNWMSTKADSSEFDVPVSPMKPSPGIAIEQPAFTGLGDERVIPASIPGVSESAAPAVVLPEVTAKEMDGGGFGVMNRLDYDPNEARRGFEWAQRQYERLLNGPRFSQDDSRYSGQQTQIRELEGLMNTYSGAYDKDRVYQAEQAKLDLERKKIEAEKHRADLAAQAAVEAAKASSAMNNYKIEVHRKKTADGIEIEKAFSEVQSGLASLAPGKNPSPELREKYQALVPGFPLLSKTPEDIAAAMAHLANANAAAKKANAEDYQDLITQMSVSDSTRVNSNQSDILQ